jgi:hypothetical protein
LGTKRRFSDSQISQSSVRIAPSSKLPQPVLPFYGRPNQKLHKLDRLTGAVYCHIRNYEFREECEQKQEATDRNIVARRKLEQVKQNRKQNFTNDTQTKDMARWGRQWQLKKKEGCFYDLLASLDLDLDLFEI